MRAKGYNTLYPMGFHYTGTPILTMAESIARNDRELIELFEDLYSVPREIIPKMRDPLELARYFHTVSKESMKRLGLGIDWRREFTTIDPEFQSFIRWQFRELFKRNYVTRGTYPVGWCPLHQMPVGGHDTKDDKDPEIGEFTLIFFRDSENRVFPTATLRPETVFAVTNLWINPDSEYYEILVEGSRWIVSKRAYEKLLYQKESVKILNRYFGRDFEGVLVRNPVTQEIVPIIPASFVDPNFGSGVVMSVPSHSPDDYVAYRESMNIERFKSYLEKAPGPRKIIEVPGVRDLPAKWIVEKNNIKSSNEREALERVTRELYNLEYSSGVMYKDLEKYVSLSSIRDSVREMISGKRVSEARENISRLLRSVGEADVFYELMNAPVYCRCGTEIVVKILRDQWFIRYSDSEWKSRALKALERMTVFPEEMKSYMRELILNLREKPCARTRGLGTPLPWDPSWIIESLSDSTIYMIFYTVIHRVRENKIDISLLDDEFWSYIVLGEGDLDRLSEKLKIDPSILKSFREEFLYWYPLDLRVAGKDLANNHLLFFIMNHVALLREELWPRAILTHGWVLKEGGKMSKSKRNITPLFKAIDSKGSDAVRLVLALSSEVDQDLDFRDSVADNLALHLKRLYDLVVSIKTKRVREESDERDIYYASRIARKLIKAEKSLDSYRVREAGNILFFEIYNDLLEVSSRESLWREILSLVEEWIKFISIYTPHIAEEMWNEVLGKNSLVVREKIDNKLIERLISPRVELEEEYIKILLEDLSEIISLRRINPSKIVIYLTDERDYTLLREALELSSKRDGLREFINKHITKVSASEREAYAERLRRIFDQAIKLPSSLRELILETESFGEESVADKIVARVKRVYPNADVVIYGYRDSRAPDLGGRKSLSLPLKPSIYVE